MSLFQASSRVASQLAKPAVLNTAARALTTVGETAADAKKLSGYSKIEFFICEEDPVYDAVQRFAGDGIGCLVTKDPQGTMKGLISERDYINKIALLGKTSKETKIKEIATPASKLVTAHLNDSIEVCMEKMLTTNVRHLPLLDENDEVCGLISIKDLVATAVKEKDAKIKHLKEFALGDKE